MVKKKSRDFRKFTGGEAFGGAADIEKPVRSLWDLVTGTLRPVRNKYVLREDIAEIVEAKNWPEDSVDAEFAVQKEKPAAVHHPEKIKKRGALPDLSPESSAGTDKGTFEKLKSGKFKLEARLDLHGMPLKEAYARVSFFIDNCYVRGKKCVLIITGKGKNSGENRATINSEFAGWLNSPGIREKIISFSRAAGKDGGSGAFYVLIRKRK